MGKKQAKPKKSKKSKNQKKESELEQESKEINNEPEEQEITFTDDNEFHQFLTSSDFRAPVLERNFQQEPIDLEETLTQNQTPAQTLETSRDYPLALNQPDYSSRAELTQESNEIKYQTTIEPPVLEPVRERTVMRSELLNPLANMMLNPQSDMQQQKIDSELRQQKTRLPFETEQERKYKEVRLK